MVKLLKILILLTIILTSFRIFAFTENTVGGNVYSQVLPNDPSPNQDVSINLTSYDFNLDLSQIVWTINNQIVASGLGLKKINFKLGNQNSPSIVNVSIVSPLGQRVLKTFNFNPGTVDLLWQANTYTPSFYQGKSLPSLGSTIKLLAIPNITDGQKNKIPDSRLVFNWYKNDKLLSESSGIGKNTTDIKLDNIISQTNIKVNVSSLTGNSAVGSTTIRVVNPQVIFYPNNSSSTIYSALGNVISGGSVVNIIAEPYYFSLDDLINQSIIFQWLSGNKIISNTPNLYLDNNRPNSLPLTLVVSNQNSILQKVSKDVTILLNPNDNSAGF